MSSADLETLGRTRELECRVVPVLLIDLQDLVTDLDQTRQALLHKTAAEGTLTRMVTTSIIYGESVPSAACRLLRERARMIAEKDQLIAELTQRAERAEAALSASRFDADPIDHALHALGFSA